MKPFEQSGTELKIEFARYRDGGGGTIGPPESSRSLTKFLYIIRIEIGRKNIPSYFNVESMSYEFRVDLIYSFYKYRRGEFMRVDF